MARSKHTDPPRIRAPRRVRAPYEPRGHCDPSAERAPARELKELGIIPADSPEPRDRDRPAPLPRLWVTRARAGFGHPAGRGAIMRVLRFFGEPCTYGLRSIELLQGEAVVPGRGLLFGRLFVPGRVVLYDQPSSPWLLTGMLPEDEAARLQRAGALIDADEHSHWTTVTWPDNTLRDFMLFDVLMHEIGHHLIQQYKGKRPARVARSRDHEAFAHRFAARCRKLWEGSAIQLSQPADPGPGGTALSARCPPPADP